MILIPDAPEYLTPQKFEAIIEQLTRQSSLNHFEATIEYCELVGVDIEDITKILSRSLKEKIEIDAMNLGYLPKKACLPI